MTTTPYLDVGQIRRLKYQSYWDQTLPYWKKCTTLALQVCKGSINRCQHPVAVIIGPLTVADVAEVVVVDIALTLLFLRARQLGLHVHVRVQELRRAHAV